MGIFGSLYKRVFSTKVPRPSADEETTPQIIIAPAETTPLLGDDTSSQEEHLDEQWQAAVAAGQIKTTWQREAKTIAVYSRSLVVTFLLQYSLNVTSIFAVGRLGTLELGAVSLATMTANITWYAPVQGLATSLDTLCCRTYHPALLDTSCCPAGGTDSRLLVHQNRSLRTLVVSHERND